MATLNRADKIRSALRVAGKLRVRRGARVFDLHPNNGYFMDLPTRPAAQVSECFVGYMAAGKEPSYNAAQEAASPQVQGALSDLSNAYESGDERPILQRLVEDYLGGGRKGARRAD
jgi:hypothetical protein